MTTTLEALQVTLAAEHAALYVYGVLGARTPASSSPELYAAVSRAYQIHRSRRDHLTDQVRGRGGTPVAAEATYEIPAALGSASLVAGAALRLERRCAETYAWLVAHTVDDRRRWAVDALTDTAVRELGFRGSPEIFPGADESADRG